MSAFHEILQRKLREHPKTDQYIGQVRDGDLYLYASSQDFVDNKAFVAIGQSFLPVWRQGHETPPGAAESIYRLADEYRRFADAWRDAPLLHGENEDGYRLLSEHGQYLLAATLQKGGEYTCATWAYDLVDKRYRECGDYYYNNYKAACEGFAIRAGLMPKLRVFSDQELVDIHDALRFTADNAVMDYEADKRVSALQCKIGDISPPLPLHGWVYHNSVVPIEEELASETMPGSPNPSLERKARLFAGLMESQYQLLSDDSWYDVCKSFGIADEEITAHGMELPEWTAEVDRLAVKILEYVRENSQKDDQSNVVVYLDDLTEQYGFEIDLTQHDTAMNRLVEKLESSGEIESCDVDTYMTDTLWIKPAEQEPIQDTSDFEPTM